MCRFVIGLACLAALVPLARADVRGDPVPYARVPAAVSAAVEKAAPGVDWKMAFRFGRDGTAWYRVGGHDRKKRFVIATRVEADGKLDWLQTDLSPDDTPRAVAAALADRFPGFTTKRVEGLSKDAETFLVFRFVGAAAGGKAEVVLVSPDGKRAMTEAEAARLRPAK